MPSGLPSGSASLRLAQNMEPHALPPHAALATPAASGGGLGWGTSRHQRGRAGVFRSGQNICANTTSAAGYYD